MLHVACSHPSSSWVESTCLSGNKSSSVSEELAGRGTWLMAVAEVTAEYPSVSSPVLKNSEACRGSEATSHMYLAVVRNGNRIVQKGMGAHMVEGARKCACREGRLHCQSHAGQRSMLARQQPGSTNPLAAHTRIFKTSWECRSLFVLTPACTALNKTSSRTHRLQPRPAETAPGRTARRYAPPLQSCEQLLSNRPCLVACNVAWA